MTDQNKLNRKKANIAISNPLLSSSANSTNVDSLSTHRVFSNHDLSRISLRPQAKLSVSQPGDAYEQKADKVAQEVMGMGDSFLQQERTPQAENNLQRNPLGSFITPFVQRSEIPGEEEEETLQMKSAGSFAIQRGEIPEDEEELIQAKYSLQKFDGGLAASDDISDKLHSRQGGGSPLSDDVRSFMEPRFGVDFSNVKVHTDGEAVQMARDVGAQAFAYGSDVYFGAGKSPGNNELTAHELTHVVQQTGRVQHKNVQIIDSAFSIQCLPTEISSVEQRIQKDDRVEKLNEDYKNAVAAKDWQQAAELLNAFNKQDILTRLRRLKRGQIEAIHQGALDNSRVGPESQVALLTRQSEAERVRKLNKDYENAVATQDWQQAAELLNAFNKQDILARLRKLGQDRIRSIHQGALDNPRVGSNSQIAGLTSVLQTGTQVENVEGTTFQTPVALFPSGVFISKDIQFVKNGSFRSDRDFKKLKNRMIGAVQTNLTNRFKLKIQTPGGVPQPEDGEYPIRVQIVDNSSASYQMQLFGQRHGRGAVNSNSGDIFELGQAHETLVPETYLAHECAHVLLGAHDEYAEAGAHASRQVFTDHSLMGNFYNEGITKAQLKPRHFGALVRLVSGWFPGRNISIVK